MEQNQAPSHDIANHNGSRAVKITGDFDIFKSFMTKEPNVSMMEFEKRERDSGFPIMGSGVQDLLRVLMTTVKPEYILELGTGVGFSSVFMAEYDRSLIKLTTVELKKDNMERALANIRRYGYEDRIECLLGDAVDIVNSGRLAGPYDLIFVDCAKAQYPRLWESIRELVKPGGIILTDDIMQDNSIIGSRFLLERRDRTIHKRMREYLYAQLNDPDFTGAVFEIDDGVTIMVKNDD